MANCVTVNNIIGHDSSALWLDRAHKEATVRATACDRIARVLSFSVQSPPWVRLGIRSLIKLAFWMIPERSENCLFSAASGVRSQKRTIRRSASRNCPEEHRRTSYDFRTSESELRICLWADNSAGSLADSQYAQQRVLASTEFFGLQSLETSLDVWGIILRDSLMSSAVVQKVANEKDHNQSTLDTDWETRHETNMRPSWEWWDPPVACVLLIWWPDRLSEPLQIYNAPVLSCHWTIKLYES